jgi:hypothetical protein
LFSPDTWKNYGRAVEITADYQGRHGKRRWKTANLLPAKAPDLIEPRFPVNCSVLQQGQPISIEPSKYAYNALKGQILKNL